MLQARYWLGRTLRVRRRGLRIRMRPLRLLRIGGRGRSRTFCRRAAAYAEILIVADLRPTIHAEHKRSYSVW